MEWYYYILWVTLVTWLSTTIIFYLKRRGMLAALSFSFPFLALIGFLVMVLAIAAIPIVYLIAFLYSIISPSSKSEMVIFERKIDVE